MSAISSCSGPSPAGGAARPTPGAARTVSIMSSISFWMEASFFLTFLAFLRSTGPGAQRIGRTANDAPCPLPDSADAPTGLGATRRSCGRLRLCLGLLFDSGGLSGEAPQVVEPGPPPWKTCVRSRSPSPTLELTFTVSPTLNPATSGFFLVSTTEVRSMTNAPGLESAQLETTAILLRGALRCEALPLLLAGGFCRQTPLLLRHTCLRE